MADFTPGDLSPTLQAARLIKEGEILQGTGRSVSELNVPIVAAQAILSHQDIDVKPEIYGAGEECINAKVTALRACGQTVSGSSTIVCDIPTGNQIGSEAMTITKRKLTNPYYFTIKESECNNTYTWAERLAYNMLKAKVVIEVEMGKMMISTIALAADVPVQAWYQKTTGTVVGNSFNVTEANFKPELYADILYASQVTDMNNPIMLNGSNFWHDTFLSQFKGIACCDNDQVLTGVPYSVYFDIKHIDTVLAAKTTLAIDKNAFIFWSSPRWTNIAKQGVKDTQMFTDELPRLKYMANGAMQPIYVDVRMQMVCTGEGEISWNFEVVPRGVFQANMSNCDDRQGVLKVTRVP